MVIDSVSIYPISDDDEFFETLKSYETEWFIGNESEPDFSQNIVLNKPYLFTLCKDTVNVSFF
jgi:hypothetical protein